MPAYIAIPFAIVAGAIIIAVAIAVALWPCIWLTRSPRAFRFRGVGRITVLLWWILAAIPWAVLLIVMHGMHDKRISVSAHTVPALLAIIAEALAVFVALVSLPLAIIVLTIVWFLERELGPAKAIPRRHS